MSSLLAHRYRVGLLCLLGIMLDVFKTYCCSLHGSQIWRINSLYYNKVCTALNGGVKRTLNLPYRTHTWMLGPVLHQYHMYIVLSKREYTSLQLGFFCLTLLDSQAPQI